MRLMLCALLVALAAVVAAPAPVVALPGLSAPAEEQVKPAKPLIDVPWLKPVQKQLLQWNMLINREIPKRMKALKDTPSLVVIATGVLAAFVYGVLHTLGPGHGKMVVATYFFTHGARFWRGVFVGLQVAFSHVLGAIVLVSATHIALQSIIRETAVQFYWAKVISYSLIMLIGLVMLVQALRHALGKTTAGGCAHCNHHHGAEGVTRSGQEAVLAWCVGLIPCTGSMLILLYAMANDMLLLGLLMVIFVAMGMAMAMTVIGVVCISGKKYVIDRFLSGKSSGHGWRVGIEACGAFFILSLGGLLLAVTV